MSTMLRDSILKHHGVENDYFYVFVALVKSRYLYNVVNITCFIDEEIVLSKEFV